MQSGWDSREKPILNRGFQKASDLVMQIKGEQSFLK